jgi:predicted transcriptional regulator
MNNFLEKFGLSEKESYLYINSLQIGESSVATLAKNAKLNRSTAYVLLEKLVEKGFFTEGFKFGKKTFRPLSAQEIKKKLQRDQAKFSKKIDLWETKIPELDAISVKTFCEPKVKFYRGEDGMNKVYQEAMKQKFFHGMIDAKAMKSKLLELYFWRIGETFKNARFKCRDMVSDCPIGREYKERYQTDLFEIKLIPQTVEISSDVFCFQDSFSMISLSDDDFLILTVESPNLAKTQLMFYESLWQSL